MNNVVVVTGGTRGLGLCIGSRLSSKGYQVIAIGRHINDEFVAATETARNNAQGCLHFVPFDLADIDHIPRLAKQLQERFGGIYALINNAGVGPSGALGVMQNSAIEHVIRINTLAPIVLTKYVVRRMMADGQGRIVNISSIAGMTGFSGLTVYGASKASIIGFTRALAREVGPFGITANAIAPGLLQTDMTQGLSVQNRGKVARHSALRRLAELDDVADAAEYLLSPTAKNITATVLTVDAGATA